MLTGLLCLLVLEILLVVLRSAVVRAVVASLALHLGGMAGWSEQGGEVLPVLGGRGGGGGGGAGVGAEVNISLLRPGLKHFSLHFTIYMKLSILYVLYCKNLEENLYVKPGKTLDKTYIIFFLKHRPQVRSPFTYR